MINTPIFTKSNTAIIPVNLNNVRTSPRFISRRQALGLVDADLVRGGNLTLSKHGIIDIMWVKQCNQPPMTGNGKHTTYKNGDDWGMAYFWPTLMGYTGSRRGFFMGKNRYNLVRAIHLSVSENVGSPQIAILHHLYPGKEWFSAWIFFIKSWGTRFSDKANLDHGI